MIASPPESFWRAPKYAMKGGAIYTKSALDAYVRTTQDRVREGRVRTIAEDAPKRDFAHPMGDGTRSGTWRLV